MYRLSETGIVECLKIIDVGCNLKQLDVEADRRILPVPISQNLVTVHLRT